MNGKINKTCCFTGHRKIPPSEVGTITQRLKIVIEDLINDGYLYFGTGGALGFDTIAAQTVLSLKKRFPDIKLILVLPCRYQTKGWKTTDIVIYEAIRFSADKIVYTSNQYTKRCMYIRNEHLVNNSSVCICYKTKSKGGTAFTVNYAKEKGLQIINVANP